MTVQFCWSEEVIESAIALLALLVFGSYATRPVKIMLSTAPPLTSLVFAGSNGFCGSPHHAVTMPPPAPPLLPLLPLLLLLLHPVATRATDVAAITAQRARVAAGMDAPPQGCV
ncbi:hypothetical protein GCM10009665_51980 [Kitasatospora nipponensis]|uniref:Uncharacterized protein n=1 Tax=Kitasatospora nipponensis TaxID=258049 RepID=A0ABP4H9K4_9ACTN